MSKFKVGDKVVCVDRQVGNWYQVGDLHTVSGFFGWDESEKCFAYNVEAIQDKGVWIDERDFELYVEEKPDAVNSPKHYSVFEEVEAIEVIASSMTQDQFYGYCFGNILKYRLRAGGKDDVMQELGKADKYQELYTQHKHLCKEKAL